MPFIVRWPGHTPAGSKCDETIAFPDMFPTICDLVGAAAPHADGISVRPLFEGKPLPTATSARHVRISGSRLRRPAIGHRRPVETDSHESDEGRARAPDALAALRSGGRSAGDNRFGRQTAGRSPAAGRHFRAQLDAESGFPDVPGEEGQAIAPA